MIISFTKMHGLGNDFIVIDGVRQSISLERAQMQRMADRHFGIGCDQILLVESTQEAGIDFRYRIFNADGGEVEQCGNGARCFARFVVDKGLTDKKEIAVSTLSGVLRPRLEDDGQVTVEMGAPRFAPEEIPFLADKQQECYDLEVNGKTIKVYVVSMGNPHVLQIVKDIDMAPVQLQGSLLQQHERFPQRVNAGYMQIVDRNRIRLRVYERGAGETLACGSGACAAVVVGRQAGLLDAKVEVSLPGGSLNINWSGKIARDGEGEPVWLTGPASTVFDGEINLETL